MLEHALCKHIHLVQMHRQKSNKSIFLEPRFGLNQEAADIDCEYNFNFEGDLFPDDNIDGGGHL